MPSTPPHGARASVEMQAGPPPSGGRSGLQGRSAGLDAPEVSHSDPEGGGACLGPSPRGPQSRTAGTRPPPRAAGLATGKAEPQEHPGGSAQGGPPGSRGAPRTPAPRCPRGAHQMGCSPQAAPHGGGGAGRQGRCCGGRAPGHRRAAQRVGRTIPDAGSRAEGPCPRAAAPWTAPQTLPCRYAQGARP